MNSPFISRCFAAALVLAAALPLAAAAPAPSPAELVAVLKSQATRKEKADACRELALVGNRDSVPVLVGLLEDEELSHMARYALETNPDPSVNDGLREALKTAKGRPLVGVIASLGVRRDPKAVKPLGRLLGDGDGDVVRTSARALGAIGTSAAGKALASALPKAAQENQLAIEEGWLHVAEYLFADGDRTGARKIYDALLARTTAAHQVRAAALRGAVLVRGSEGDALMKAALVGSDYAQFAAAVRTAQEISGPGITRLLSTVLPALPPDRQVVVAETLGVSRDPSAVPALLALAAAGTEPARLCALRALAENGSPAAVPGLVKLLADPSPAIAQAAQETLGSIPGSEADQAVTNLLNSGSTRTRLVGIELAGRRRMMSTLPGLLAAASDADAPIRPAAWKRLGELAGPSELPALLDRLQRAQDTVELDAAEQALTAILARAYKPGAAADLLVARVATAHPAQKVVLIRVLGTVGGSPALRSVRAALDDPSPAVHGAAVRTLSTWPTVEAGPDLLVLTRGATDATERTLFLRGYLTLAAQAEMPADQRWTMCESAAPLVQQAEETRLLLTALCAVGTTDALRLALAQLEKEGVKDEAATALVTVSEKILQGNPDAAGVTQVTEALTRAAETTGNAELAKRARDLKQQAAAKSR